MSWDADIFNWFHGLTGWSIFTDSIGVFLAKYLAYILVAAALVFIFKQKGAKTRMSAFIRLALSALIARGIIAELAYFAYFRIRPFTTFGFTPLVSAAGSSFPSGHVVLLFSLGLAIWTIDRRFGSWFLALSFVNGLARIFAGVHYPTDILGGIAVALLGWAIAERLLKNPEIKGASVDNPANL